MYKEHHVRTTLEVEMSKKRTPLWREAHFQVKSVKAEGLDHFLTFGRRKVYAVVGGEAHVQVKSVKNCGVRTTFGRSDVVLPGMRKGFCTLWKVSKTWGFVAVSTTTTNTLHYTTLHYTTLHHTTPHHTALHYAPPHYTTLHSLHYTTLHYNTIQYIQ